MDLLVFTGNVALAALLGTLIGLERQLNQHPAGLRTNALVCMGAALFVSLTPLLGDTAKVYRDLQLKGGEEKKAADEMLKALADQEKEALAAARAAYGDACVDVISKRVKELGQFQLDLMKELTGQLEAGKK